MFGKLFAKKDHHYYLTQAGKYLAAERYADARIDFEEALKRCPADAQEDRRRISEGFDTAGNRLGELNLQEAEHAVRLGDFGKARDHFMLASQLSVDAAIKAKAGEGLQGLAHASAAAPAPAAHAAKGHHHGGSSCGSCKDTGSHALDEDQSSVDHLSKEELFTLLIQPLPGDLPKRYAALGPDFAGAYLAIHDGKDNEAFPVLQKMLLSAENDIVIYELALIMFRNGQIHECEKLLNRALSANPANATCYVAKIHLLTAQQRFPEALATASYMVEQGIMADQAQFMLGELHHAAGDEEAALQAWSKALEIPSVAKGAAERVVPILESKGRTEEAKFLRKKYLKGCC